MNELLSKLAASCGSDKVKRNVPLSRLTTFRTGGRADIVVSVTCPEEIRRAIAAVREAKIPYYVLGRGSNVVFCDEGFRGAVIRICEPGYGEGRDGFSVVSDSDEDAVVYACAGSKLSALAAFACSLGLTGLEFASGIPGSVGGGILMNAGAYGGELKDCAVKSEYIDPESGAEGALEGEAQGFGYRESAYQKNGFIVTGAYFKLAKGKTKTEISSKMRELNARRRDKQPLDFPSAGSAFKRPAGDFAGRLIEASGLKGFSVGGAGVSEKHCGFIINRGGATSSDVIGVVRAVREKVFADSGVLLEPEIRFVGETGPTVV